MTSEGHIYLIGMPCCGKTTLGRAVAAATGVSFIDLDEAISKRVGMSVPDIFQAHGEDGFRRLESAELVLAAALPHPCLIACGGGTPCFGSNIAVMDRTGTTVYLDASPQRLAQRLHRFGDSRPLVRGKSPEQIREYVSRTLGERRPFYSKARERFDSSRLDSPDEVLATVSEFCRRFLPDAVFDAQALRQHIKGQCS